MAEKRNIHLTLSEHELRLLVETMYIAHWVVCGGEKFADRSYQTAVEKLEQRIYQLAAEQGHKDLVEREPGDKQYFPTGFLEEESKAREALSAHDEENFWEELISRLSILFAARETGLTRWEQMSEEGRFRATFVREERIREVLNKQGLQGLF